VSRLVAWSRPGGTSIGSHRSQAPPIGKPCHEVGEELCAGKMREAESSPFPLHPSPKDLDLAGVHLPPTPPFRFSSSGMPSSLSPSPLSELELPHRRHALLLTASYPWVGRHPVARCDRPKTLHKITSIMKI
jgi:hypothetical protein